MLPRSLYDEADRSTLLQRPCPALTEGVTIQACNFRNTLAGIPSNLPPDINAPLPDDKIFDQMCLQIKSLHITYFH